MPLLATVGLCQQSELSLGLLGCIAALAASLSSTNGRNHSYMHVCYLLRFQDPASWAALPGKDVTSSGLQLAFCPRRKKVSATSFDSSHLP
jgi:hypothetical protein